MTMAPGDTTGATNTTTHPQSASDNTAFPTFLDTDPFPSNPDGRPLSSGSATTDATSDYGPDDFRSAKERQSNIPSLTGPVGEPGLPPSRPSSVGTTQAQRASARSSIQPPPSRRGLTAFVTSPKGSLRGEAHRPSSAVSRTHVPTIAASGFANPMSSKTLQAQRGQRLGAANAGQGQTSGQAGRADQTAQEESDRAIRRRYSNASVNTLRDVIPPNSDEDAPPLPVSRGTDGTHDFNFAVSVASATSSSPLNAKASANTLSGQLQPRVPTTQRNSPSPARSLRTSLRLSSRTTSWQRQSSSHHRQLHSTPSSPVGEPSEKPPIAANTLSKASGKNYEYYAGNLLFFARGRLLNTKAKPLNLVTLVMTLLPCALFFGFSAPWLWHHVSPAIPIIFAYITYLTLSSFFHAALSDPGILPRNVHPHPVNPEEERDPLTVGPPTTDWVTVRTFTRKPLPNVENGDNMVGNAMEVPSKYCKSCSIWRPPRAHHCRTCDGCVETHDHHCAWLNNCVGRRNYRFFFTFISAATILSLLLVAFSVVHIALYAQRNDLSFLDAFANGRVQERVAFAMLIYSILAFMYPASLTAYHVFLITRGETTREYLNSFKFTKKDRHRPFTQASWLQNWIVVLIRPRAPSYMEFKRRHLEGDLRQGHITSKKQRKAEHREKYSVEMDKLPSKREQAAKGSRNGMGARNVDGAPEGELQPNGSAIGPVNGSLGGPGSLVNNTPR